MPKNITQQVRYLDKLDELAKGRKMEKILRAVCSAGKNYLNKRSPGLHTKFRVLHTVAVPMLPTFVA